MRSLHPEIQYATLSQQGETAQLGMWVFIATEILMFGGLFVAYGIYRGLDAKVFHLAHEQLNWKLGAVNTCVLLFSSLTAAVPSKRPSLRRASQTDPMPP